MRKASRKAPTPVCCPANNPKQRPLGTPQTTSPRHRDRQTPPQRRRHSPVSRSSNNTRRPAQVTIPPCSTLADGVCAQHDTLARYTWQWCLRAQYLGTIPLAMAFIGMIPWRGTLGDGVHKHNASARYPRRWRLRARYLGAIPPRARRTWPHVTRHWSGEASSAVGRAATSGGEGGGRGLLLTQREQIGKEQQRRQCMGTARCGMRLREGEGCNICGKDEGE